MTARRPRPLRRPLPTSAQFGDYSLEASARPHENGWEVIAYDKHRNVVGHASWASWLDEPGEDDRDQSHLIRTALKGWNVEVASGHQRQGLATAMYDLAERAFDMELKPNGLTDDGAAFWKFRRERMSCGTAQSRLAALKVKTNEICRRRTASCARTVEQIRAARRAVLAVCPRPRPVRRGV